MTRHTSMSPPPRERLLTVAATLFAQCGFNGISTRDIAASAGVSEITIYRHYPNKRDLFFAAIESELKKLHLRGDMLSHIAESQDWQTALTRTYELISNILSGSPELIRLIQFGILEMQVDIEPLLRRFLGHIVEILAGYVQPWLDKGKLPARDAKAVVMGFMSIVLSYPVLNGVFGPSLASFDPMAAIYVAQL